MNGVVTSLGGNRVNATNKESVPNEVDTQATEALTEVSLGDTVEKDDSMAAVAEDLRKMMVNEAQRHNELKEGQSTIINNQGQHTALLKALVASSPAAQRHLMKENLKNDKRSSVRSRPPPGAAKANSKLKEREVASKAQHYRNLSGENKKQPPAFA